MAKDEFNPDDYKTVKVIGQTSGKLPAVVTLKSYKGAKPKIKIDRVGEKKDGTEFNAKLGGLDATEAREVSRLLVEAANALDKL